MNMDTPAPLTLLVCALGGEGGGVLAEWLVNTAMRCGYASQSTSIPGVAQRTGSTTYYFEVFPVPLNQLGDRRPVFSLYPVPGALDMLVSSELLETARQVGNGMTSPARTRVITSSARTLTTEEKMQLADGRAPAQDLVELVRTYCREARIFDMAAVARDANTVSSAVMFGAIAGSGLLPFPRDAYEATIRGTGIGVDASLRGFARAWEITAGSEPGPVQHAPNVAITAASQGADLSEFPGQARDIVALGHARMLDYQDGHTHSFTWSACAESLHPSEPPASVISRQRAKRHASLRCGWPSMTSCASPT